MEPVKNITYVTMSAISRMKNFGYTTSDYEWIEQLAIEFYQEKLRGYEMPSVVVDYVTVNANTRIWPMPSDFIRYTKVGYKIGNRVWTLGIDNTIALSTGPEICNDIQTAESGAIGSGFWIAEGFYNGTYYGPLYTAGGGFNVNYYRVNEAERYIQFVEALPTGQAVVEYLSSGRNVNGNTLVPVAYVEPFRNYLIWQMCELKPEIVSMAKDKERQYKDTLWDANILVKGPVMDEAMDTIYAACGFNIR
jgi:hypothetical protein